MRRLALIIIALHATAPALVRGYQDKQKLAHELGRFGHHVFLAEANYEFSYRHYFWLQNAKWLEFYPGSNYGQWLVEAEMCMDCWRLLAWANNTNWSVKDRLKYLERLKGYLGEDAYMRGAMIYPAPFWRYWQ